MIQLVNRVSVLSCAFGVARVRQRGRGRRAIRGNATSHTPRRQWGRGLAALGFCHPESGALRKMQGTGTDQRGKGAKSSSGFELNPS